VRTYIVTAVGFFGMALIVGAYFINSYGLVASSSILYLSMNLVGSACVGIDVYMKRAWSAVTLQIVWIVITICALIR